MKLKFYLQTTVILIIISILVLFYYTFFKEQNFDTVKNKENLKEIESPSENQISNELNNLEYNATDKYGNTFYIYADKALIKLDDEKKNNVQMQGVVSVIGIKNKGNIYVYADRALYNKISHDTSFFDNIKIEYINNLITSENFDIFFTKQLSMIYNNVICQSNNLNLYADKIQINMISGDIKLQMLDSKKKVKLVAKNESN